MHHMLCTPSDAFLCVTPWCHYFQTEKNMTLLQKEKIMIHLVTHMLFTSSYACLCVTPSNGWQPVSCFFLFESSLLGTNNSSNLQPVSQKMATSVASSFGCIWLVMCAWVAVKLSSCNFTTDLLLFTAIYIHVYTYTRVYIHMRIPQHRYGSGSQTW